jgi:hypothetical protein
MNEQFGFYINRPFHIVSRMPFHRVVEAHGNNHIYHRRYVKNKKQQQWTFNGVDKTIHNGNWKNYCLEGQSNGAGTWLMMTSNIQSRWW